MRELCGSFAKSIPGMRELVLLYVAPCKLICTISVQLDATTARLAKKTCLGEHRRQETTVQVWL